MGQLSDNCDLTLSDMLQDLRLRVASMTEGATAARYSRALGLFTSFLTSRGDTDAAAWRDSIAADWQIHLWLVGVPLNTALLYLDIISSLFNGCAKEGLWFPTKAFSEVKSAIKALPESVWSKGIDSDIFERALALTKSAPRLEGDEAVAADLVLYSLITGCTPLREVAMLTRATVPADREARVIARRRIIGTRRKYIFPLGQAETTRRQVELRMQALVSALFRSRRLPVSADVADTVESLWAYAALRCGAAASDVVGFLGRVPLGVPMLRLAAPAEVSAALRADLTARVASVFLSNPEGWYAMSMRPGVRFPGLDARVRALSESNELPSVTLFYPCEEIKRVIKKKVVCRQRPFISDVVFFRTRATDIVRIFSRIGDIAWCYTTTGRPGAPYARVSQMQFERFQQTIARFTPDFEVGESGALPLKENDRVKVVGGIFCGMEAEFEDAAREEEGVVYRLKLIGDNGIDWRISLDPRLVDPL